MRAIIARPGGDGPEVATVPRPEPGPGEALVRTLRVGVDGTDQEVIASVTERGQRLPEGADHLVLGHEAVGVVEDPNGTDLAEGDLVVPTVRRPPDGTNEYFERGEADMAPEDCYHERGIAGAHGFMAEWFTSPAEFLVPVPDAFADLGFLVEPASITEKALELARASRSTFDWRGESALVLGNGSLGLLTLAMLDVDDDFERLYCLGRRDRPDPTIDLMERLGATYVDSRETPPSEIPAVHEEVDLVYEATGYAPHAFGAIEALAPNGVAALLGVPDDWTFEVDGGKLHREVVMQNKAIVGSVNSGVEHFEAGVERLREIPDWFFEEFVTGVYEPAQVERAFADDDSTIKTAVEFDSHEER